MKLTLIQEHGKPGPYQPTQIDKDKANADIRIMQVNPFIIESKINLSGRRGVQEFGGFSDRYQVSDSALQKLQSKYWVVTDF